MTVEFAHVDLPAGDDSSLRVLVATPPGPGRYPGLLFYSDIFQWTGATLRSVKRFAGHGFTVFAPDLYRRIEPAGTVLDFDADRQRALDDASRTTVADFDADRRLALDALAAHERVTPGALGAVGFCIGGHLAFRAALEPRIRATATFYATGVHDGTLGASTGVDTLARAREIRGDLLVVWGETDPHVPPSGRDAVASAVRAAQTRHTILTLPGDHAFMRDEGPRYDPQSSDAAYVQSIAFLRELLAR